MAWAITATKTNMITLGVRWNRSTGAVAGMDLRRLLSEEEYGLMCVRQFPGAHNILAKRHRQADDGHENEHEGDYASEFRFHNGGNIAIQRFFYNINQTRKTFILDGESGREAATDPKIPFQICTAA